MNARSTRRAAALLAVVVTACDTAVPTQPVQPDAPAPAFDVVAQSYVSGSHVMTWDAIAEPDQRADWDVAYCATPQVPNRAPKFGRDADWKNPHNAFQVWHSWQSSYFVAPWINAWSTRFSSGGNPTAPHHNWTRYATTVEGNGSFVIRLLADNCSWIYLDGILVGTQGTDLSRNSYGLTLDGEHTLEFIVFDGGGDSGGKFLLETTTNPPPPLNDDLDDDGHVNTQDAFPLDATEWVDSDGDGVGDNGDAFPDDPNEQTDSDGDGVGDNGDAYPNDPTRTTPDSDGDGVDDEIDVFPNDPAESADSDGDGVGDNADAFDASSTGATIVIGSCNTGVGNRHLGNGTWFNDLIAAAYSSAANHGAFVNAVTKISNGWKRAGLITGREHGAIVSCAARTK